MGAERPKMAGQVERAGGRQALDGGLYPIGLRQDLPGYRHAVLVLDEVAVHSCPSRNRRLNARLIIVIGFV